MHEVCCYCVPLFCTDFGKFKKHTNSSLRNSIVKLNEFKGTISNGKFEDKESFVYGYNWNPYSLITEPSFNLDIADSVMYDWGHAYVCNGIGDDEFG